MTNTFEPATHRFGKEEWRDIPGFEGLYQVSDMGRIRPVKPRYKNKPFLSPVRDKDGYLYVRLKSKFFKRVHRAVLEAFIGLSDMPVDHLNNAKDDNRLINLQYVTPRENVQRRIIREGKSLGAYRKKSTNVWHSQIYLEGIYKNLGRFNTQQDAQNAYNNALNNHYANAEKVKP